MKGTIFVSKAKKKLPTTTPNPEGRPTKYKPEYCDQVIKHMEQGYSFETFGGTIDVCFKTTYNWKLEHPEFLQAVEMGFIKCQIFWEKMGIQGLFSESESITGQGSSSRSLNSVVWKFNMANRFRWRDNHDIKADIKADVKVDTNLKLDALIDLLCDEETNS